MPEPEVAGVAEDGRQGGRLVVVLFVVAAVAVGAYFAFGMPGMSHGATTSAGDHEAMVEALPPAAFANRMAQASAFLVNVHVPDGASIAGTAASIPFDRIAGDPRLPDDKTTQILLYCRTGRMSKEAGATLMAAGYGNVAELAGGMDAWEAAGRPLVDPAG